MKQLEQHLQLYSKGNCHLCDVAKEELLIVKSKMGISFQEIDIYKNNELIEMYGLMIPVVKYKHDIIQYGQIDHCTIIHFLNSEI